MRRVDRAGSFPDAMQGRWVELDGKGELAIHGGEVTCFGAVVEYDYKEVVEKDGALTVSLRIEDLSAEDTFQRTNATGFVIDPKGQFHAYNVKFVCIFVRQGADRS